MNNNFFRYLVKTVAKNILIIEDNEDSIFIIEHFLKKLGYNVSIAENGEQGIQKALAEIPDLILMDMMMPIVDGYEATKKIKESSDCKNIPIIALTAHASVGDKEKTLQSGCDDYLAKPIELQKLNEVIQKWLM